MTEGAVMDIEELKAMIPSETVRQYMLDAGWTLTDMQKAALLYHSNLPMEQQHFWLRGLRDKTGDECLRTQLTEYLDCREQGLQAFKENIDRNCIYVLRVKGEDGEPYYKIQPHGYFSDWRAAFEIGKRENFPFQIEKHIVYNVSDQNGDDCNSEISSVCFNQNGEVLDLWSSEIPFNVEEDGHFTYAFYEVPNPFERGDIVKLTGTEDYGIVEPTQQMWKDNLTKWRSPEWRQRGGLVDYSDVQIRVVFLDKDGTFSHAHINPVALERYQPKTELLGKNSNPMDNLLLYASMIYQGRGSLEDLYVFTMQYRNSKENV